MSEAVLDLPASQEPQTDEDWLRVLSDPWWRITHLYRIVDEDGRDMAFRPNEEQQQLFRTLTYWNCILKARQLGFCLDGDTRVLTADLRWRRIADLRQGDELVGVDEHVPGGRGASRKMRPAVVQATKVMKAERFRITFDDGRSVVCTANHPWLSRKSNPRCSWRSLSGQGNEVTGRIKVGTEVRWICKPWEDGGIDDGWFGGVIDGEGSLSTTNRAGANLSVSQLPGPVWDRMVRYAERRGYSWRTEDDSTERKTKYGKSPVPRIVFSRMDEMFRLIGQTRPARFVNRQWWSGRDLPGKRTGVGWARVTKIEPIGVGDVVDLQTSTGTYIAEGFVSHNTTLLCIMALDQCLFVPNFNASIIAHNLEDAQKFFRTKVKYAYDHLPERIKAQCLTQKETTTEIVFKNGSSISVSTSARSGTVQWLHVSEFGKMCARFPEKAREVVTGSFNAVPRDGLIFIESTAEGQGGYFYDYCMDALRRQQEGKKTARGQWKLHFFPWYGKASYTLDDPAILVTAEDERYFDTLLTERRIELTVGQKRWYVAKKATLGDDMKREFPSFPEEAFEQAIKGAIYASQMAWLRANQRIGEVPHDPALPVNTFWDFGVSDTTAIWLHQRNGMQNQFFRYYERNGEGLAHFVQWLMKQPNVVYGTHYLPHDADARIQGQHVTTKRAILEGLGLRNIVVVPRVADIDIGIDITRQKLPTCWFDKVGCAEGIKALDGYQYAWDENRGTFSKEPLHNWASHGSDAMRQFAQGYLAASGASSGFRRHRWSWRS